MPTWGSVKVSAARHAPCATTCDETRDTTSLTSATARSRKVIATNAPPSGRHRSARVGPKSTTPRHPTRAREMAHAGVVADEQAGAREQRRGADKRPVRRRRGSPIPPRAARRPLPPGRARRPPRRRGDATRRRRPRSRRAAQRLRGVPGPGMHDQALADRRRPRYGVGIARAAELRHRRAERSTLERARIARRCVLRRVGAFDAMTADDRNADGAAHGRRRTAPRTSRTTRAPTRRRATSRQLRRELAEERAHRSPSAGGPTRTPAASDSASAVRPRLTLSSMRAPLRASVARPPAPATAGRRARRERPAPHGARPSIPAGAARFVDSSRRATAIIRAQCLPPPRSRNPRSI